MVLGDAFPSEFKIQFAIDQLAPGCIIRIHTSLTTPPKMKFFVVAYEDDGIRAFIINSKLSEFVMKRPDLRAGHVTIFQNEHPDILSHDSYVDCTRVFKIPTGEIVSSIGASLECLRGPCSDAALSAIMSAVEGSVTLSPVEKSRLLEKLGSRS